MAAYKVQLTYFRLSGKFLAHVECEVAQEAITQIWATIHDLRRMGSLPGLRPNAGRDLFILVDVPAHPQRALHLVMPPFVDNDDITPVRVATSAPPVVRIALEELPSARTTTRDIVKVDLNDEEITPVEVPLPKPPLDEP
jgi:hypothetical protein